MLKLFPGLALACLSTPVWAADSCSGDMKSMLAAAVKDGAPVLANFRVSKEPFDREVILSLGHDGAEMIWFFAKGCAVGEPIVLMGDDAAPAAAPPPPSDPAPSKPQGGGAEINS